MLQFEALLTVTKRDGGAVDDIAVLRSRVEQVRTSIHLLDGNVSQQADLIMLLKQRADDVKVGIPVSHT